MLTLRLEKVRKIGFLRLNKLLISTINDVLSPLRDVHASARI